MRENPWAAVPLLDDRAETQWFKTETDAIKWVMNKPYSIQYRPGRKPKPKPKRVRAT